MAEYVTSGLYPFVITNGGADVTLGAFSTTNGPFTFSDGQGDNAFDTDDPITVTTPGGSVGGLVYVGQFPGGFVLRDPAAAGTANEYFAVSSDSGLEGTVIVEEGVSVLVDTPFIVCFLAGTLIATPDGVRAIEELVIGDLVLTAEGHARPVRWIGRQTIASLFADRLYSYPIRITAGALDEQLPERDLYVSPEHALMIDGVLVQAGALVNGITIARVTRPEPIFTYYHVELEDHSLILAEGVPAETFVDNVTRRRFDNWAEYEALYGKGSAAISEIDLPRVKSARQLPAGIRGRLAGRAADVAGSRAA